eukprot:TRINITY_DN1610_c0_g1_i4.p1 TRINITY_DN1610_c0_g1~~TRINITY_DN1610_c0_g1_i4.p1  ORF type:complete len:400 (-),score=32.17 TRINITY_DN1610_c0_g1_i4:81-1280(-)
METIVRDSSMEFAADERPQIFRKEFHVERGRQKKYFGFVSIHLKSKLPVKFHVCSAIFGDLHCSELTSPGLELSRKKRHSLLSSIANVLTPNQLRDFIKMKGEMWHGGMVNAGWKDHLVPKRNYSRFKNISLPGSDKRLMVIFVPLPLAKENTRNLIRATYRRNFMQDLDLYFSIGKPETPQEMEQFEKENKAWGDMVAIPMKENMNDGKTWHSFNILHRFFVNSSNSVSYDFYCKLDDDSFIFDSFFQILHDKVPRTRSFVGLKVKELKHMPGSVYLMTEDLLDYVATDPWVALHIKSIEDHVTASWMSRNESRSNWIDFPGRIGSEYSRVGYDPRQNDNLLHKVKTSEQWNDIYSYYGWAKNGELAVFLKGRNNPKKNSDDKLIEDLCIHQKHFKQN